MKFGCFEMSIDRAVNVISSKFSVIDSDITRNNKYTYVFMQIWSAGKATIITMNDMMEQNQVCVKAYRGKKGLFKFEIKKLEMYEQSIVDLLEPEIDINNNVKQLSISDKIVDKN